MKDADGVIQIPGMYDDVAAAGAGREAELEPACRSTKQEFLKKEVGSTRLTGEPGYSVLERIWARPTLEVHGIAGGFTGAGAKTVIPAKATAKVSMRLVPNQDPEKIVEPTRSSSQENTPEGIQTEVRVLSAGAGRDGESRPSGHPDRRRSLQRHAWARRRSSFAPAARFPIVGDFAKHLGIPTILMGFGLPDDGLHSPNEKYKLANYYTGIMTIAHFFEQYGK